MARVATGFKVDLVKPDRPLRDNAACPPRAGPRERPDPDRPAVSAGAAVVWSPPQCRFSLQRSASATDFLSGLPEGQFSGQLGSHLTHRWREMDSNHRYPRERNLLLPRSELARWNRLAAGTGCRLQRAKVSAYSNVSNGAEREPPDLRISLLAGARAVGPGQQMAAAGLVRPIFPDINSALAASAHAADSLECAQLNPFVRWLRSTRLLRIPAA